MALSVAPVSPIIPISPISAFDNRNVLVPLPVSNNRAVQDALQQNGGNQSNNTDLFPLELNNFQNGALPLPGSDDVIAPIAAQTPEIADTLEQNGGNQLDNGIAPSDQTNDTNEIGIADNRNLSNAIRSRLITDLNDDELTRPFNDNISTANSRNPIPTLDTATLPLESITILQEAAEAEPQATFQSQFNIYSFIVNALQGGANEYSPSVDEDTSVEFEA